jgi:hypothetical protein
MTAPPSPHARRLLAALPPDGWLSLRRAGHLAALPAGAARAALEELHTAGLVDVKPNDGGHPLLRRAGTEHQLEPAPPAEPVEVRIPDGLARYQRRHGRGAA